MGSQASTSERSGQANAPQGAEQTHILVMLVNDRPGAVDRVVGVLRRRRANMQTLVLGKGDAPDTVRATVLVTDSEVGLDHLVEQMRKLIDVREVTHLPQERAIRRELALVKVTSSAATRQEIIERSHGLGAHIIDVGPETVTVEVIGSSEKVARLIDLLQDYDIQEVARSGEIAMARGDLH